MDGNPAVKMVVRREVKDVDEKDDDGETERLNGDAVGCEDEEEEEEEADGGGGDNNHVMDSKHASNMRAGNRVSLTGNRHLSKQRRRRHGRER